MLRKLHFNPLSCALCRVSSVTSVKQIDIPENENMIGKVIYVYFKYKEFCCIAEIMLHVVTQSQAIYAGTAKVMRF